MEYNVKLQREDNHTKVRLRTLSRQASINRPATPELRHPHKIGAKQLPYAVVDKQLCSQA